jgi:hypothetical protein
VGSGTWRYIGANGIRGNLELDINFMIRAPLWPSVVQQSRAVGSHRTAPVRVLDLHEIAAGKLAALLSRNASRDLFDAHALLGRPDLDRAKLRLAFVVYGGLNRKEWRTISVDDVKAAPREVQQALVPICAPTWRPREPIS